MVLRPHGLRGRPEARGAQSGQRSASYARQAPYEGSHRQVRAAVLHHLAASGPADAAKLPAALAALLGPEGGNADREGKPSARFRERVRRAAEELEKEGFLVREGATVRLKS
jgi:hypothetical protein